MKAIEFLSESLREAGLYLDCSENQECANCHNFGGHVDSSGLCIACDFLTKPKPDVLGWLTSKRALSVASLRNAVVVFQKGAPIRLCVSQGYAKAIPSTKYVKCVVFPKLEFIVKLMESNDDCLIINTYQSLGDDVNRLVLSRGNQITINQAEGNVTLNRSTWHDALKLLQSIDATDQNAVINSVRVGLLTDQYLKDRYYGQLVRLGELLNCLPHARYLMLDLLEYALNEDS